jgi:hypothetical protein
MLDGGAQRLIDSPYSRAALELIALGYHPIPIMPPNVAPEGRGKAPGNYVAGTWHGMGDWTRFQDRPPSKFECDLWRRNWPEANIGVVVGQRVGSMQLIAIDIDATDFDEFNAIARALPRSPMVKRGAKGETRFFLAPVGLASRAYDVGPHGDRRRLVDLLASGRQTVVPPSVHPQGPVYLWLAGPVPIADLPILTEEALTAVEETFEALGWNRQHEPRPTPERRSVSVDDANYWTEIKQAAMADFAAWVPQLGLYKLRPARRGYEAVATWRESKGNRPLDDRKRNLSIQPEGIKDFGDERTYTPIDLVMQAQGLDQADATRWLAERLGMLEERVLLLPPPPATVHVLYPSPEAPKPPARQDPPKELPARLTRTHGLVGAIADWVTASARKPNPVLALGAALSVVGCAAGRLYAGPTRTGTHLYILAIAPTGSGKDHPLRCATRLLTDAGLKRYIGPDEFMSQSALVNRLEREPLTFSAMDEIGAWIAKINSRRASTHEQAITKTLRTYWGASFESIATPEWAGKHSSIIHAPALSILGASVHEEFYAALEGRDHSNGFLNRFLLLSTHKRPASQEPDTRDPPEKLIIDLRAIRDHIHPAVQLSLHTDRADDPPVIVGWRTPDAGDCWRAFAAEMEDREQGAEFYVRTAEMAQRIATVIAIGANYANPRISLSDIEWAIDLARWSADRMRAETEQYAAETDTQAAVSKILRAIREHGDWMKHSDLLLKLRHTHRAKEVVQIMEGPIASGQIECRETTHNAGGTRTRWYRIEQ